MGHDPARRSIRRRPQPPVPLIVPVAERPSTDGDGVPLGEEREVGCRAFAAIDRVPNQTGGEVPRAGRRLDVGRRLRVKQESCCPFKREPDHWVVPRSYQWIVVDVEDPFRRRLVFAEEDSGRNHHLGREVVAERLDLQRAVDEELVAVRAEIPLVGVDVEAAAQQHPAEPEVVAAHRRMAATVERCCVRAAQELGNEDSGGAVVEQDAVEAAFDQWAPAVEAFGNVRGHVGRVVPELDDHAGWGRRARACGALPSHARGVGRGLSAERRPRRSVPHAGSQAAVYHMAELESRRPRGVVQRASGTSASWREGPCPARTAGWLPSSRPSHCDIGELLRRSQEKRRRNTRTRSARITQRGAVAASCHRRRRSPQPPGAPVGAPDIARAECPSCPVARAQQNGASRAARIRRLVTPCGRVLPDGSSPILRRGGTSYASTSEPAGQTEVQAVWHSRGGAL